MNVLGLLSCSLRLYWRSYWDRPLFFVLHSGKKKKKSHPKVSDDDESFKTFEAVVLEEVVGSQNP